MPKSLPIDFTGRSGSFGRDVGQGFLALMRSNLAIGKGVSANPDGTYGLLMTPGVGLAVNVSPGTFVAQLPDVVNAPFSIHVPPNYSGYVWIEANDVAGDVPKSDYTESLNQTGYYDSGTWICLGRFVSTANSVTTSGEGRMIYGHRVTSAVYADVSEQIAAAVPKFRTDNSGNSMGGAIDGANKVFTLSFAPIHGGLDLTVTGWDPGDYSLDGNLLTFDVAPPVGATIKAQYPYT